jgi:hypothetical protein
VTSTTTRDEDETMITQLKTLPREAVLGTLRLWRTPIGLAENVFAKESAEQAVSTWPPAVAFDKVASSVAHAAGVVLNDEILLHTATVKRAKVAQIEAATEAEARADSKRAQADEELARKRAEAERKDREAAQRAEQRKAQARTEEQQAKQRVKKQAAAKEQAVDEAAQRKQERIDAEAREARQRELEAEKQALAEQREALEATKAAVATKKAAGAVKKARKATR